MTRPKSTSAPGLLVLALVATPACIAEYRVPMADAGTVEDSSDDADETATEGPVTGSSESESSDDVSADCPGVDTTKDPEHCGACDSPCGPSEVCDLGVCAATCSAGLTACGRSCVDLTRNDDHCDECGEACEPGYACVDADCVDFCEEECDDDFEVCVAGVCECRSGFVECGGTCVDTRIDPQNCGDCGIACDGSPCGLSECQPGGCGGASPTQCDNSCVDTNTDPSHCGWCESPCDPDEVCVAGECEDLDGDDD